MREEKIKIFENILADKLICGEDGCSEVNCFEIGSGKTFVLSGKNIIIASGGASAIYSRTTNPPSSIGEGISLAYNAGAEIESMEFIQFHPTAFFSEGGESFLISEAVRGEGAYLVDHKGRRFLAGWNSNELAPRDEVSIAIFNELKKSGMQNVFLKLDHLDPDAVVKRFGTIYEMALRYNIDITKDPIPVAPAAHYLVGGIKTGLSGETNIERLYAIGEAASTGVHGANRLASNSLLECLVFAKRAIEHASHNLNASIKKTNIDFSVTVDEGMCKNYESIRKRIGELMWNEVGIIRNKISLERALKQLGEIEKSIPAESDEYYNGRIRSIFEVAKMIACSALFREESRGCHDRPDFQAENYQFARTVILRKGADPILNKL